MTLFYLLLETRLLQDAVQRPGRHINAGFSCDGHRSRLGRMTKLPMTAFRANLGSSVGFDQSDKFPDLHRL